jgi:acyl-CoA reductase-like NAD-dependent aldehyde dehydrogenase
MAAGSIDQPGDTSEGYWVRPHVFVDVPPSATIAQEEIFGPVLSVLRARDFDSALAIAGDTPYGLTGGVYSRSPLTYTRHTGSGSVTSTSIMATGAMVGRQPRRVPHEWRV